MTKYSSAALARIAAYRVATGKPTLQASLNQHRADMAHLGAVLAARKAARGMDTNATPVPVYPLGATYPAGT